jgi:hypothetical protein
MNSVKNKRGTASCTTTLCRCKNHAMQKKYYATTNGKYCGHKLETFREYTQNTLWAMGKAAQNKESCLEIHTINWMQS